MVSKTQPTTGHWLHHFEDLQMSAMEFYASLEQSIRAIEVHGLSLSRITHYEAGILSPKRVFLRVSYKNVAFDICAAPLGRNYFISFREKRRLRPVLKFIPVVSFILEQLLFPKTYYQIDTEEAFKRSIHSIMHGAVNTLRNPRGRRWSKEAQHAFLNANKLQARGLTRLPLHYP